MIPFENAHIVPPMTYLLVLLAFLHSWPGVSGVSGGAVPPGPLAPDGQHEPLPEPAEDELMLEDPNLEHELDVMLNEGADVEAGVALLLSLSGAVVADEQEVVVLGPHGGVSHTATKASESSSAGVSSLLGSSDADFMEALRRNAAEKKAKDEQRLVRRSALQ